MIKLVCSDLDGTFVTSAKTIPQQNAALLDRLAARGAQLMPCSGRPLIAIPELLRTHAAVKYVTCSNGAEIYDAKSGDLLRACPLLPDAVRALTKVLEPLPVSIDFVTTHAIYTEAARRPWMEAVDIPAEALAYSVSLRTFVDMPSAAFAEKLLADDTPVVRMGIFFHTPEDQQQAIKLVESLDPTLKIRITSSMVCNIEFTHTNAHKGAALEWVAAREGLDVSQTLAFGDGENDATMLVAAGDGVAMAVSHPAALAAANHQTISNDDAGVAAYANALLDAEDAAAAEGAVAGAGAATATSAADAEDAAAARVFSAGGRTS